jgi:hypothetical protein
MLENFQEVFMSEMSEVDQMNFERFAPKQSILDTNKGKMNQRQFKD